MVEAFISGDVLPLQMPAAGAAGVAPVTTAKVKFDLDHPSLFASVAPASTSTRVQDLTVTGNGSYQSATSFLNVHKTSTSATGTKTTATVGALNLQLMRPKIYNVHIHFVSETAPQGAACGAPNLVPVRTPATQADLQNFIAAIQSNLDTIWLKQANVKFNVSYAAPQNPNNCAWPAVATDQVHYDLGNALGTPPPDGKLQLQQPGADPNNRHNVETDTIINTLTPAPSANDINVYFVKQFANLNLQIATTQVKSASINLPYQSLIFATGGTFPYVWSLTQGMLPPGMMAQTTAAGVYVISGTPTQQGAFNFTLQVMDSDNPAQSTSQAFTITVGPPFVGPPAPFPPIPAPEHGTITLGFATKVGEHTIFVDDNTSPALLPKVLPHELGHALGLSHMSEHQASDPQGATSCTFIPGLHLADSDFTDQTALMWYLVRSPIQGFGNTIDAHLGIRNWTQLNSVIDGQSAYNPNCTP
jgi:hypothetical protein